MQKQNYKINLLTKNISNSNNEYEYSHGEILKSYQFNIKPKQLYSKLKPILKQQQYNLGLYAIEINETLIYLQNNIYTNQYIQKHNLTLKQYLNNF